ncbi:MAG: hypothetical protein IT438_04625 [Phycisphaerales bacterium]|nr:hypothetical protein [Phycisphaerales bacterium]
MTRHVLITFAVATIAPSRAVAQSDAAPPDGGPLEANLLHGWLDQHVHSGIHKATSFRHVRFRCDSPTRTTRLQ